MVTTKCETFGSKWRFVSAILPLDDLVLHSLIGVQARTTRQDGPETEENGNSDDEAMKE